MEEELPTCKGLLSMPAQATIRTGTGWLNVVALNEAIHEPVE